MAAEVCTFPGPPWVWSWSYQPPQPPAVCTGAGHPPTDLALSTDGLGRCGICEQRVGVDANGRCVTHPYYGALRGVGTP